MLSQPIFYIVTAIIFAIFGFLLKFKQSKNKQNSNMSQALIKSVDKYVKKINKNDSGVTVYKYEVEILYRGSKCTAKTESSFFYEVGDYVRYRIVNGKLVFDNMAEEEENEQTHRSRWPYRVLFILSGIMLLIFMIMNSGIEHGLGYVLPSIFLIIIITRIIVKLKTQMDADKKTHQKIDNGTIVTVKGGVICFDRNQTIPTTIEGQSRFKVVIKYTTPDGEEKIDKQNFYVSESWPHDIGDIVDLQYDKSTDKVFLIDNHAMVQKYKYIGIAIISLVLIGMLYIIKSM